MLGFTRFHQSMSRDDELNALNNNFNQIETQSGIDEKNAAVTPPLITPDKLTNPYKFSAYRAAAQNPAGGVIGYDTEIFDTNSNFDITTNKGRYTVPITGYYQLNVTSVIVVTGAPQDPIARIRKNATTEIGYSHMVNTYAGTSNQSLSISILVKLTAGDYIEVVSGSLDLEVSDISHNTFSGFLVSET